MINLQGKKKRKKNKGRKCLW